MTLLYTIFEIAFYTIVLVMSLILSVIAISKFLTELVDRLLGIIDRLREIIKTGAMDSIQVWTSAYMSSLDVDRQRAKLELNQDMAQVKLDEYKQNLNLKRLKAKSEVMK